MPLPHQWHPHHQEVPSWRGMRTQPHQRLDSAPQRESVAGLCCLCRSRSCSAAEAAACGARFPRWRTSSPTRHGGRPAEGRLWKDMAHVLGPCNLSRTSVLMPCQKGKKGSHRVDFTFSAVIGVAKPKCEKMQWNTAVREDAVECCIVRNTVVLVTKPWQADDDAKQPQRRP